MNIIVRTSGKDSFCFRPDTTWERENKDFFSPDFMRCIMWSPVVFARISRAGKCIGKKFADRYFDAVNFGMLMYNGDILKKGTPDSLAFASIVDRSTILPFPLFNPAVLKEGNFYEVYSDGKMLFSAEAENSDAVIHEAVCSASEFISLRTGDIVAAELADPEELHFGNGDRMFMEGKFCGNGIFRFNIIM